MSKIKCNHCHLAFDESVMIEDGEHHFCCKGCQGVFHILNSEGLGSFYDKLGNKTLHPPKEQLQDTKRFDLPTYYKQFVKTNSDGFSQIDLIIEGIHCAACVWLNEKILHDTNGILEANINFTNNKAKIIWDDDIIKLSEIIEKIRSIGYDAFAYTIGDSDKIATKAKREYFTKIMVAVFATMNIMMIGVAKYTGFFTGIDPQIKHFIHVAEFIFATPVLFYSGQVFFKGAYFGIKNKIVNMDLLVATGSSLTYLYSIFVLFGLSPGESYFDSVSMIITFVLVGKYLEVLGKKSAVDTLDTIRNQIPTEATVIKNGTAVISNLESLQVGDIIELKPGEKASIDGEVVFGEANFDESSITGESLPVYKKNGAKIISGTICLDGLIRLKCTQDFEHSTLNSIVTMLEDSLASKPKIEQFANNISKYFSLSILSIAIATFFAWYFGNFDYYGLEFEKFEKAFIVAISVVVIACPCALALATPIATLIGISTLAKKGLIFKEAKHIETLAKASMFIFDKTGTLTYGKLKVTNFDKFIDFDENILFSFVSNSKHPISQSIKEYLIDNNFNKNLHIENFKAIQSSGIEASFDGKKLIGGNLEFLKNHNVEAISSSSDSIFAFAIDSKLACIISLEDCVKPEAFNLIETLKKNNIEIKMLTGDNEFAAKKIADLLQIQYLAGLNPVQKSQFVENQKNNGHIIVCIGDGINDALMLSKSDIAVSMGSGADVSISISDIVILNDSLENLKNAFLISKRTYKFIKQNLAISLGYNALTIPLAIGGFVIPLVAALSMSLSSLIVVGNSMRIKKGF